MDVLLEELSCLSSIILSVVLILARGGSYKWADALYLLWLTFNEALRPLRVSRRVGSLFGATSFRRLLRVVH